ncbi:hypothetical protein ANCCAN_30036, partial [Ancylostoma caninum]
LYSRKRLLDRIVTPKPPPATVSKLTPPRKPYNLFDFRSSDIACQMTYIDSQLFHLIEVIFHLSLSRCKKLLACRLGRFGAKLKEVSR